VDTNTADKPFKIFLAFHQPTMYEQTNAETQSASHTTLHRLLPVRFEVAAQHNTRQSQLRVCGLSQTQFREHAKADEEWCRACTKQLHALSCS
jgi:hypothetical protein